MKQKSAIGGLLVALTVLGALLMAQTPSSDPPLLEAVKQGNHETVKQLLGTGEDVNETGEDGLTSLMAASAIGDASMVETLLNYNATPNATMENGATALLIATAAFVDGAKVEATVAALYWIRLSSALSCTRMMPAPIAT